MTGRSVAPTLALVLSLAGTSAALGEPFSISRWTVDGGGTGLIQPERTLVFGGSIGQPDAGRLPGGLTVLNGGFWHPGGSSLVGVPIDPPPPAPIRDAIFAANPNPFAGTTRVSFSLSAPGRVDARVYDVRGGLVRTLAQGGLPAGTYVRVWDACDESGRRARPGIYLLRVRTPALRDVQKLVILR